MVLRLAAGLLWLKAELTDTLGATRVINFSGLETMVGSVRMVSALVELIPCKAITALHALEI